MATSIAAVVGPFRRGLLDEAVRLQSLSDFERELGGIDRDSEASYAIQQFFLNGGGEIHAVRVGHPGPAAAGIVPIAAAEATLAAGPTDVLRVFAGRRIRGESAENPGEWGNRLRLEVSHNGSDEATFDLAVSEVALEGDRTSVVRRETFRNLTLAPNRANSAVEVVNAGSALVQLEVLNGPHAATVRPDPTGTLGAELAATPPAAVPTGLSVLLDFGGGTTIGPVAVAFPATLPASPGFPLWAQTLQAALRATATDAAFSVGERGYLAGATVSIVGAGTTADPRRFHVRAGSGARPFDPDVVLVFSGADAGDYGLDASLPTTLDVLEGPQQVRLEDGEDGTVVDADGNFLVPVEAFRGNPLARTGLHALEDVDLVNVIAIPDAPRLSADDFRALYTETIAYASDRRAMVIVDIPENVRTIADMETFVADFADLRNPNAALYYPRGYSPDPMNGNRPRSLAASGTIAGLWARTDTERGVFKAPAGTDARLRNVASLVYTMTDAENGILNPLGVNCLRTFPVYASICWGARTLDGADRIASEWKYVPVRRTTLFIEESLYRGTQWVVFEPNDEPLWAQIRLNVGAFMHDLFTKGFFQGAMPSDAYFVKCDGETTTQTDIDNGIVNVEVGFAPLKPAEFVILRIQQIARTAEA